MTLIIKLFNIFFFRDYLITDLVSFLQNLELQSMFSVLFSHQNSNLKCRHILHIVTPRAVCLITILHCKCYTQTHTLSGPSLAQLASLFVEAIKVGKMGSGKSLELFPTVLTALSACEVLSYGKGLCKYPALVTLSLCYIKNINILMRVQMLKGDEFLSLVILS